MALISPILDNRTYEQLRDELVRRIPVYTPDWTDHNESDPGIVLLELFAHLGESLLYRFNQIPDTTRVEFLRLLGVQPLPAQPASVLLCAVTDDPAGTQILAGAEASADSVSFETTDELYVWPLEAIGAGKTATDPGDGATDSREDALARAGLDPDEATFYRTVLTPTDPNAPDAAPIDVSEQVDNCLWVALLARPTTELSRLSRGTLFLGVAFDERITEPPVLGRSIGDATTKPLRAGALTDDPPPTEWELWEGQDAAGKPVFHRLAVLGDTTRGMVTTGVVKLELPAQLARLRTVSDGLAGNPPPIDDEDVRERVVGWLRVRRPQRNDIGDAIHRVLWVGANCVAAEQSRTPPAELLGVGSGNPDQRFPLAHSPVLRRTVRLQVEEPAGWRDWEEVENFARSGLDDRHYTVDHQHGAVVFGRKRMPQIGEQIRVLGYRYSDGSKGNLPPKTITRFPQHPAVTLTNPLKAQGGTDPAPLTEALAAIPGEVHRHDRAVTPEDYQALAREVDGVARAEVLTTFHPDTPSVDAAGVTTVVVLPRDDVRNPDAPLPDIALLRRVAAWLEPRRLVTAELYVIPPEYVRVAVSIAFQVRKGYQVDAVRRWVEQIVRQYLAAVPPNGPDAAGWPLGRAVRAAELEAVAVQVEGVEYAIGTRLATLDPALVEQDVIGLLRWQLPEVSAITVVAGELPPKPGVVPVDDDLPKVPVPLPPEVC